MSADRIRPTCATSTPGCSTSTTPSIRPSRGFMGLIERRMTDFVVRVTGLPRDEACALQKRYLARARHDPGRPDGRTTASIPHDFLADVHDVPLDALAPDPALRAALDAPAGPAAGLHQRRRPSTPSGCWSSWASPTCSTTSSTSARPTTCPSPHPATFARMIARPRRRPGRHRLLRGHASATSRRPPTSA